ncbi:Exostosin domain-containing protein [Psidium guajava]|nr:Exostosin domain-containing protein [Psidium guajava]
MNDRDGDGIQLTKALALSRRWRFFIAKIPGATDFAPPSVRRCRDKALERLASSTDLQFDELTCYVFRAMNRRWKANRRKLKQIWLLTVPSGWTRMAKRLPS